MADVPLFRRPWVLWGIRALIVILVGLGVSGTVNSALAELGRHPWNVRPQWLIAAGLVYAPGLVPMAWFWHRTLTALGQPAPWQPTLRAYFMGHIGKYVPGKAMAVVLRVAGVRKWVTSIRIALVTSLLETLTMMAVGAFLAAILSTLVLRLEPRLAAVGLVMAIAAGLPTLPPIARRLARIGLRRIKQDSELVNAEMNQVDFDASLEGINLRLLASGWAAAVLCWTLLGVSLWATLMAVGVGNLRLVEELPRLVAAVAFSVVAGFLSMLPGGLLVRDAILMQLLVPVYGEANSLVAAVFLRLVWLVTEVAMCGILYVAAGSRERGARSKSFH